MLKPAVSEACGHQARSTTSREVRRCVRAAVCPKGPPYNGVDPVLFGSREHSIQRSGAQFKEPFQGLFRLFRRTQRCCMLKEGNAPLKGSLLACFGAAARRTHERSHALGGDRA